MTANLAVVQDPYGALVLAGREAFLSIEASHWRLADLAVQVVAEHREEGETINECLDRYAVDIGVSVARETVRAYRLAALRWPPDKRHEGVSFSAHYELRYHQDLLGHLLEHYQPATITSALARNAAKGRKRDENWLDPADPEYPEKPAREPEPELPIPGWWPCDAPPAPMPALVWSPVAELAESVVAVEAALIDLGGDWVPDLRQRAQLQEALAYAEQALRQLRDALEPPP